VTRRDERRRPLPKRELIPAGEEHQREFPLQFQLKPEFRDNPECQMAFEHATKYKLYPDEIDYIGQVCERIELRADGIEFVEQVDETAGEEERRGTWLLNIPHDLQVEDDLHYFGPPELLLLPQMQYLNFNTGEHCPPISCPMCRGGPLVVLTVKTVGGRRLTEEQLRAISQIECPDCDGLGIIMPRRYGWHVLGEKLKTWRVKVKRLGLREAAEKWGLTPSRLLGIEHGRVYTLEHPYWREAIARWTELESLSQSSSPSVPTDGRTADQPGAADS
jgi:hypothetical protein